jgi:hypothetical protein
MVDSGLCAGIAPAKVQVEIWKISQTCLTGFEHQIRALRTPELTSVDQVSRRARHVARPLSVPVGPVDVRNHGGSNDHHLETKLAAHQIRDKTARREIRIGSIDGATLEHFADHGSTISRRASRRVPGRRMGAESHHDRRRNIDKQVGESVVRRLHDIERGLS